MTCNDLMYEMICINCSGVTCPWKVGMIGLYPATIFDCGFSIDSLM